MSFQPIYHPLDWIPRDKLDWEKCLEFHGRLSTNIKELQVWKQNNENIYWPTLCENPTAFTEIENNINKIDESCWRYLCENPNAVHIIAKYVEIDKLDDICWELLCGNPNAMPIINKHIDKILEHPNYWDGLLENPNAVPLFKRYPDKIDWISLCSNTSPEAMKLISENIDKLCIHCWFSLVKNPSAISVLEKHLDKLNKVDLWILSENPNAIPILEKRLDKIDWSGLSKNPNAIFLLEQNIDKIVWHILAANTNGGHLLEANIDKFYTTNEDEIDFDSSDWMWLAKNPSAITIIEKCINKIDWQYLCENPNAVSIIKKNMHKMDTTCWKVFSKNPSIFVLDQMAMKEQCRIFAEDLAAYVFHPERVERMAALYHMEFDEYMELI